MTITIVLYRLQEKTASLTELRGNIQSKAKSLKRRRGQAASSSSTTALKQGLNGLADEISALIDLVKRLSQCATTEGRNLVDSIQNTPGLTAGQELWKRALKAWCFEAGDDTQDTEDQDSRLFRLVIADSLDNQIRFNSIGSICTSVFQAHLEYPDL